MGIGVGTIQRYQIWNDFRFRVIPCAHDSEDGTLPRMHMHADFCELVVVRSGTGLHVSEGVETPLEAGDIFLIAPGVPHDYRRAENLLIFNVLFPRDFFGTFRSALEELPNFQMYFSLSGIPRFEVLRLEPEPFAEALALLERIVGEQERKSAGGKVAVFADALNFMLLVCRFGKPGGGHPESPVWRISRLLTRLSTRYREEWRLADMARAAGLSVSTFRQKFRTLAGLPPAEWLLRRRLEKAAELLREGKRISSAAEESGFRDSNYFSRQFRKYYGTPPREYAHRFRSK